jgi:ElaB/YqjD/DUF883 family membrane-anchored ribosome-binding protein
MTDSAMNELAADLKSLLSDAEALLRDARNGAGEKLTAARESLGKACEHLRHAESEIGKHARAVDRAVRDHPWKAILATGLVAFCLGLLVRRR